VTSGISNLCLESALFEPHTGYWQTHRTFPSF